MSRRNGAVRVGRGDDFDRELAGAHRIIHFRNKFRGKRSICPVPHAAPFRQDWDRAFFFGATTHFMLWNPDIFLVRRARRFSTP
jgi:hypothetical protein